MPSRELLFALALAACRPSLENVVPEEPAPEQTRIAAEKSAPPSAEPVAPEKAVAVVPAAPEPEAPPPPAEPALHITLDSPYKLDGRPEPKTQEEYKRDILDQRHWNGGGLGLLVGEQPPVEGHPDPRVIVNVETLRGGHDEKKIEIFARRYHWIQVVRCYRLGAYKDRHLRGWTRARVKIASSGKVTSTKLLESELDDEAVARCMTEKLAALAFPKGSRASDATFAMRVGPGDEPMPPPEELIVPGEGELALEEMQRGVEAGIPAFEACYRAALTYAPGLWGRLILRFHLTERGELDEAFQVNRRFPDPRLSQCVEHAARKLSFVRPAGGEVRFVVPVRLWTARADTAPPSSDSDK